MKSEMTIDEKGTKNWKLPNGDYHRENGPAVVYLDGDKEWFVKGERHREDGPAIDYPQYGHKEWWIWGERHREDGPAMEFVKAPGDESINTHKEWWIGGERHRKGRPAIEYNDGGEEWYIEGKLHREDGPALIGAHGRKEWYLYGFKHRLDGPSVTLLIGHKEWHLYGTEHTEEEFKRRIRDYKLKQLLSPTSESRDFKKTSESSYFEFYKKTLQIRDSSGETKITINQSFDKF